MSEHPTSIFQGSSSTGRYTDLDDVQDTREIRRPLAWNPGTDAGLLLLRIGIGGLFLAHGVQKVFGLWGGLGVGEFARALEGFGYQQATTLAWATGIGELVLGAFVVLGVLTPLSAAGLLAISINAVLVKLGNGFFIAGPGGAMAIELDVLRGLGAAALVLCGPGRFALDNGRAWHRRPAPWGVLSLVIGVAAAVLVYVLLR